MISIQTVTPNRTMPAPLISAAPEADPTPWIRTHQKGVWRYLRALGCDPASADDLTQDTFLAALDRLGRGEFRHRSDAQSRTYLKRTARNLWLGRQRRSQREATALADAVDALWDEHSVNQWGDDRVLAMRQCIDQLQARSAEAVGLFYREGLSRAQVAVRMGLKETGVKTLLQRVRAALKECVEGAG